MNYNLGMQTVSNFLSLIFDLRERTKLIKEMRQLIFQLIKYLSHILQKSRIHSDYLQMLFCFLISHAVNFSR